MSLLVEYSDSEGEEAPAPLRLALTKVNAAPSVHM